MDLNRQLMRKIMGGAISRVQKEGHSSFAYKKDGYCAIGAIYHAAKELGLMPGVNEGMALQEIVASESVETALCVDLVIAEVGSQTIGEFVRWNENADKASLLDVYVKVIRTL